MTLTELKALFRRWVKVLPGGPTDKTRGAGMLTILDALATEIVSLPLGTTVVRLDLPDANQLLLNTPPDEQVAEGTWYTIDGDWNSAGTDSRVFVWGLSGNKFSPVGLLRDALGKDSFVEVDVLAGTAVAASGRVPAVWELQEEGAPLTYSSLNEAAAKSQGLFTFLLLRTFYSLTAQVTLSITSIVGNKAFVSLNGWRWNCNHADYNDLSLVDYGPIPNSGGLAIGDGANKVWKGGTINTALHLDLGTQIFDGVTITAQVRAGAAYAVTTNNAGTKIILRGGSTLTGTVDPRMTVIDQNAGSGPPPDLSAYAKTTDVNTLVGTLANLATTAKTNAVAAINELAGRAIARYYTALGGQTDGALTVKAATDALATKASFDDLPLDWLWKDNITSQHTAAAPASLSINALARVNPYVENVTDFYVVLPPAWYNKGVNGSTLAFHAATACTLHFTNGFLVDNLDTLSLSTGTTVVLSASSVGRSTKVATSGVNYTVVLRTSSGGGGGTAYTGAGRIKVNGTVISYEQEADVYSTSLVAGNQPQGVFPALGANSDGAIVLFDTVTRDPGHNANLAGSYYTVPVTGYYFIVTKVRIADNAPAGKRWAQWPALLGDDSSQARVDTTGPQWSSLENTWQPHLTAGQRVYCRVFLDGFTAGAAATMEVRLLRADS